VKLLDFGIAKMLAVDDVASESGTLTAPRQSAWPTPRDSAPSMLAGRT